MRTGRPAHNSARLVGHTFGRLTVICDVGRTKHKSVLWKCVCECGQETVLSSNVLKSSHTQSCGCYGREQALVRLGGLHKINKVHGETHSNRTKEYKAWGSMKERCLKPSHPSYPRYGGRGVKICPQWAKNYLQFLGDMGRAKPGESLDRIDVDGDYSPENCRWADAKTQSRNKTNTLFMDLNGRRVRAIEVAGSLGVGRNHVYMYLRVKKLLAEKYGYP